MLLAKLNINLKTDVKAIDRELGRFISKDLAGKLTAANGNNMLAFYPSSVNVYSIELIVEVIGNMHHRRMINNRIDFDNLRNLFEKQIIEFMPHLKDNIASIEVEEISFCEASARMIYCYKHDDYLIPDSDPPSVMSLENIYERANYTYNGRFMPFIKLWADLVNGSNNIFTGMIVKQPSKEYPFSKDAEFRALSATNIMEELKVINSYPFTFRPFNKFYKILVSNRTMIPITVQPIVESLYLHNQLCSRAIYVLDIVNAIACSDNDSQFIQKVSAVLNELRGATLVVLVDIPNHFIKAKDSSIVETDALHKAQVLTSSMRTKEDSDFYEHMLTYNLMDIEDTLDWPCKVDIIRNYVKKTDSFKKSSSTTIKISEYSKINPQLMNTIYNLTRNMNVIFAYTDTLAYDQMYGFEKFIAVTKQLSIRCVPLSDSNLDDEKLRILGQGIGCEHFQIDKILENRKMMSYIDDKVDILVSERTNTHDGYSSLYGYRYLVHQSFDYRFQKDLEETEYFKHFKEEQTSTTSKSTNTDEKQITPSYGAIDDIFALRSVNIDPYGTNRGYVEKKEDGIELDKMIGLTSIKKQVYNFADFVEVNKIKESKDLKPIPISKHMVFMGNPGTAKTTVAVQLGKILHNKGLIPTADVKQVARDDLVGLYVGHSARHTKEAIDAAKGGILFVDEAYSLTSTEGGANSFGQEVINTFVNYMDKSDIRDSTIIIFAGYKDEMVKFIESNPGLKSRIGFYFDFPDYTTDELIEIAKVQADNAGYILQDGYLKKLRKEIEKVRHSKDFGNGRLVRSIFEKSILKQASRLAADKEKMMSAAFSREELVTLTEEDFSTEGIDFKNNKKSVGFVTREESNA